MSATTVCPACKANGSKALLGVFPVNICMDEDCGCIWGLWSSLALWLHEVMNPDMGGWMLMTYPGSYLKALWVSVRGEK